MSEPAAAGRRSRGLLAVLLLAALTLGALGAGFGGWLGWRGAPPLPDNVTAGGLARAEVLRGTPQVIERHDVLFGYPQAGSAAWLLGGDNYSGGYVKLIILDGDEAPKELAQIRAFLLLDLWRLSSDLSGPGYSGSRRQLSIKVYPATLTGARLTEAEPEDAVVIEFSRAEPERVQAFTVIGCLLGLALGWFGAGLLIGRASAGGAVRRWPAATFGMLGMVLLLPGTVLTAGQLIWQLLFMPGSMPNSPSWGLYLLPGIRALTVLGVLLLIASVLAVLPAERERHP